MKYLKGIILLMVFCLIVTGCAQKLENAEVQDMELSYALEEDERTEYRRGETINVHAIITNVSNKTYAYRGIGRVDVAASLYCEVDGETYRIRSTMGGNDVAPWDCELAPGETSGCLNIFKVPSDAPLGSYHIRVYYKDFEQVFENVLTVIE